MVLFFKCTCNFWEHIQSLFFSFENESLNETILFYNSHVSSCQLFAPVQCEINFNESFNERMSFFLFDSFLHVESIVSPVTGYRMWYFINGIDFHFHLVFLIFLNFSLSLSAFGTRSRISKIFEALLALKFFLLYSEFQSFCPTYTYFTREYFREPVSRSRGTLSNR